MPGAEETDPRTINFADINRHLVSQLQKQHQRQQEPEVVASTAQEQSPHLPSSEALQSINADADRHHDNGLDECDRASVTILPATKPVDRQNVAVVVNEQTLNNEQAIVDALRNEKVATSVAPTQSNNIINSDDYVGPNIVAVGVNSAIDGDNNNISVVGERQGDEYSSVLAHNDVRETSAVNEKGIKDENHVCRTDIDPLIVVVEENVTNINSGAEVFNIELQTAIDHLNASIGRVELETAIEGLNATIERVESEVKNDQKCTVNAINGDGLNAIRNENITKYSQSDIVADDNERNRITSNDQSFEDQEIERLIHDDKEELKRLTDSQIQNLFKLPESQDIYKQVESCYRETSASPPPVPLNTYRWEDVRRSKLKVRYFAL